MKMRYSALFLGCILIACTTPTSEVKKEDIKKKDPPKTDKKSETNPEELQLLSKSVTLNAYKRDAAMRISQRNLNSIYTGNPQALLRSVIVIKYVINADGKLLHSEIIRSNHDKITENTAMSSISIASPFPKAISHLLINGKLEIIETWLFNDDGRFQLRTIALPQLDE
jgi:protein TonB